MTTTENLVRMLNQIATPRVTFAREYKGGELRAVARAKCPYKNCWSDAYEVAVPLKSFYGKKKTKEEAKKMAVALAKAQVSRHLRARLNHG